MKFSDDLLKSVSAILEAKPRVSFDGDKATVHSKNGTPMKSFNKKDLGNSYRKHADNFLSQNYKKLNAESVVVEELEEAKQLELPGMEKKKPQQLELPFGKKDDKKKPVKESEDQLDEISKGAMGSYVKKASDDVANRAYHSGGDRHDNEFNSSEKTPERKKLLNRQKGIKTAVKKLTKESEDVNASNAAKATMHDCANHVRHEQYGLGQTISTMHTLEEDEDGNGYVTHYDVMFQGEDGPFIMEDVWVEDLEIISEKHHGHPKGKKKMSEDVEAIDEKKGHKKDKGDMDGDGVDEPDDKEYMDNKDKAIKAAMSKKKSESPIKKVEEEFISEEAYEIADLILEYFPKEKIGQSKNYHIKSVDPESGAYSLKHKKTGEKSIITVRDNQPFSRTRHVNRQLQKKYGKKDGDTHISGADRHAIARHINKHIQHTGMEGSDPKKDKAGTGDVRRALKKDGMKRTDLDRDNVNEAPTYVPGFMGADGKPTSKPTKKDYDSNKEYQSMKKKLGDRIPGPPAKKINKEHLESISAALQEISNKTLHSYITKASDPKNKKGVYQQAKKSEYKEKQYRELGDDGGDAESIRAVKREKGIRLAASKLSMSGQKAGARKADKNPRPPSQTQESNEFTDQLADRVGEMSTGSHKQKVAKKKAMKAFNKGDYEKAADHADVHLRHPE